MKRTRRIICFSILIALTICTFQSWGLFSNVIHEQDEVSGTSRSRSEFEYSSTREMISPLIRINQTILKQTGPTGEVDVRIFDRILLQPNSFRLEDRIYLILDGKPYSTQVDDIEFERLTNIQEKRKDVITADSSKVSVVTGIDRSDSNYYKLSYSLNQETIDRIKTCNKLLFRYYTGPDMITTSMNKWELKQFIKLLNMP